jgi:hypothetical protein
MQLRPVLGTTGDRFVSHWQGFLPQLRRRLTLRFAPVKACHFGMVIAVGGPPWGRSIDTNSNALLKRTIDVFIDEPSGWR